ncbi:MAG: hypothetical protein JWQ43_4082 [Glaciihabitans sp.]|nr:hypothetical protein [Glaciihabitans sp.]
MSESDNHLHPSVPPVDGQFPAAAPDDEGQQNDLAGHTIEELGDYLDAGCQPSDPSIDDSPGCQIALAALGRLRTLSVAMLEAEALDEPPRDDSWLTAIVNNIGLDARAGRDIPIQHSAPSARLSVTEGAVRGMIRAAGDSVAGVIIGSCRLDGDVTVPGEPITVRLEASVAWGAPMVDVANQVRRAVYTEMLRHTELTIVAIDVTIHDVMFVRAEPSNEIEQR